MEHVFFNDLDGLFRTLVIGLFAYAGLVCCLRVSGKRTLSKMNAFDLIVTISLGSTLATILLSKDVALAEGMLALSLLIALQFVMTFASVRFGWVRRLVTGEPLMLLQDGELLPESLRHARVTQNEVYAAVRAAGVIDLALVKAVVLETDGSFSVLQSKDGKPGNSSLQDVRDAPEHSH